MTFLNIILLILGAGTGVAIGNILARGKKINIAETRAKADKSVKSAVEHARGNLEQAKKQAESIRSKNTANAKTHEDFLRDLEKSVRIKEEASSKREKRMEEMRVQAAQEEEHLSSIKKKHEEIKLEQVKILSQKAGKTPEAAKEQIIKNFSENLRVENEEKLKKLERFYDDNKEKYAKAILLESMQKISTDTSTEKKSAQMKVPRDYLKAELVGRNGENVKEFENLLEVDIIFNDFPDTISVSSHNLLQRHIAEIALERLFGSKKNITPAIVREAIKFATAEVEKDVYKIGLAAIKKLGIKRNLPQELIGIIGRLHFRTSYGQNIMRHSMEVAFVSCLLGGELGLNMETCRIGSFLHDLGKAIDQDPGVTGGHDYLTKKLMTKYGFPEEEIHAAWTHHEAEPPRTPEAMIVKAADAISAGRPGARQESIDKYIERIRELEEIPGRFQGVKKAFAISAGREIRVLVDAQMLNDKDLNGLAVDIAKNIEEEVGYPGKVKINVIRRTNNIEYTK